MSQVPSSPAPASPDAKAAAAEKEKELHDAEGDLVEDAAELQMIAQEMVERLDIVGTRKVQKTKSEKMHVDYVVHVVTSIPVIRTKPLRSVLCVCND